MAEAIKNKSVFEQLQLTLDYLGIDNDILAVNQKNPIEQLIVSFPIDDNENSEGNIGIEMMFIDELDKLAVGEQVEEVEIISMLQFFVNLGIKPTDENIAEMTALILRFNSFLPIGSFGLSEQNDIFFRYTLALKDRNVDSSLFIELLDMINFYIRILGHKIVDFANKKLTFQNALQNGIKELSGALE